MAIDKAAPRWRDFEEAAARFSAALDPNARVVHNAFTPDRDTGQRRQRDVWIEVMLGGFFPLRIHVSCKDYSRQLHSGDIDAFIGELSSSGAHKGVVYSRIGFTRPALQKAESRGICCCRLYMNEPAELPASLKFSAFCCNTQVRLSVTPWPALGWRLHTWSDVFSLGVQGLESGSALLLDELAAKFCEAERLAVEAAIGRLPTGFSAVAIVPAEPGRVSLTVTASGRWRIFQANVDAFLVDGCYSFNTGRFLGNFATPAIDRFSSHPGPGWTLIAEPPVKLDQYILVVLYGADTKAALLEQMASAKLAHDYAMQADVEK